MGTMKSLTPDEHKILKENFWDKNKRLTRPMSPHLGIYKVKYIATLYMIALDVFDSTLSQPIFGY